MHAHALHANSSLSLACKQTRFRKHIWQSELQTNAANQLPLILLNGGTGTQQLRAQRPAARPRLAVVRRATGQGEKQATQKAEDDVEQMAAPEGDRALAGAPMD